MTAQPARQMTRISLPPFDEMTAFEQEVYRRSIEFFGAPTGPRLALMQTPELSRAWAGLLDAIKSGGQPARLMELTILIVARHWRSTFEWWAHEEAAVRAGLPIEVIDALCQGQVPAFAHEDEQALYEYLTELLEQKRVSQPGFERLQAQVGSKGLVELTALAGHYGNVAQMLIALDVQLPDHAVARCQW